MSDWANYNRGYTGNILNQPQSDEEAYKQSSPICFANGLKGHFLIELRKENGELAAYPVENHAFTEPSNWADEYKRIFRLFESTLK